MGYFSREDDTLVWQENQQKVWIRPWGANALRVQANLAGRPLELPQALLEDSSDLSLNVSIEIGEGKAGIRNGMIQATMNSRGHLMKIGQSTSARFFAPK